MCAIFGRFAPGGIGDAPTLCGAVQTLAHRGPDDGAWWSDGAFFLGHRRLAIIDLSGGVQPMATECGRYVVVFNGEIYNFVELREELRGEGYRFRTSSDTEVLLHGYHAWGCGLPERLLGMFAFAIADRVEQTLFVARDRFGEKPLFLCERGDDVTFSSELRALAALPDTPLDVDVTGLGGFLSLNYVPGERTLLEHVRRLPAASWRLYRAGKAPQAGVFWSLPTREVDSRALSMAVAKEQLLGALDRAIRITLRGDVPITLFLSGGIDSSVVASRAARHGVLEDAYCLDFAEPGYSELANASVVARRLGLELRRVVLEPSAMEDFLAMVEHLDDPLGDSSALAVWTLSREVSRDYKVAISGDGGDELFAGYLTYPATRLHQRFLSRLPGGARRSLARLAARIPVGTGKVTFAYKLARFLRAAHLPSGEAHFTWNGSWLPQEAATLVGTAHAAEQARSSIASLAERHGLTGRPDLLALQCADVREYLANDILSKVDRMSMAHGLESRTPLLDPEFARLALTLPERFKLPTGGPPKHVLRKLAEDLLGPRIARARKQGFSIPVHRWLRGPARDLAEDLLSPESLAALPMLDAAAVAAVKERHMTGRGQLGFELWGLMVLVAWHRARVGPGRLALCGGTSSLRRLEFPRPVPRFARRALTCVIRVWAASCSVQAAHPCPDKAGPVRGAGTVGRRGEAERARHPVDVSPAERARHGWRALVLQAEQECAAPQAAVECTGTYSQRVPAARTGPAAPADAVN